MGKYMLLHENQLDYYGKTSYCFHEYYHQVWYVSYILIGGAL